MTIVTIKTTSSFQINSAQDFATCVYFRKKKTNFVASERLTVPVYRAASIPRTSKRFETSMCESVILPDAKRLDFHERKEKKASRRKNKDGTAAFNNL